MRDFAKLRIYKFAQQAAVDVHVAFKRVEDHDDMSPGLMLELSQATHQVCAKIGAAHTHRLDLDRCVENLAQSKSKAAECMVFLDLAQRMGYLSKDAKTPLWRSYRQLLDRLGRLIEKRLPYDDYFEGKDFGGDEDE